MRIFCVKCERHTLPPLSSSIEQFRESCMTLRLRMISRTRQRNKTGIARIVFHILIVSLTAAICILAVGVYMFLLVKVYILHLTTAVYYWSKCLQIRSVLN